MKLVTKPLAIAALSIAMLTGCRSSSRRASL